MKIFIVRGVRKMKIEQAERLLDVYASACCTCQFREIMHEVIINEMTSGEWTCENTTDEAAWCFVCSVCGKSFPKDKLHLAYNHGEVNYCPNCGAKVVKEVVKE